MDAAYYQELLRPLFQGRHIVLVGMMLAGATAEVTQLRRLGAQRCLVIAIGRGTGPIPSAEDADWVISPPGEPGTVQALRQIGAMMTNPRPAVREAIERFDPDHKAIVIPAIVTLGPVPEVMLGRRVWGGRPNASLPLEDKTSVDGLWDRVGIQRAPALIAPASIDALIGAHRRMDRGQGTVMAGDALEGPHGGAHLVRWVRNDGELSKAIGIYAEHCSRVRVMPFLEGIPCSVHGLVFSDFSLALRPVELVVLRPAKGFEFLYAGAATYWDPPHEVRSYMRSTAGKVADAFRQLVGPGCFTIDGILTEDGWLPTELNPRFGAGLSVMARGLPDFPLIQLCQALQAGERLDFRPRELESWLLAAADEHRYGGAWTPIARPETESREYRLTRDGTSFRLAGDEDPADATLMIGPGNTGGFVRFTAEPARTPAGPSIAPAAVAAFALADHEFGTGLGELAAARDVSR